MLRQEGCHLGDAWYFVKDGLCHCYYLVCPQAVPRHTAWDIAHATSTDLINWEQHGKVVTRGAEGTWDHSCISTGSVVEHQGAYWMAYTGPWNGKYTQIGVAVSNDLYHWEKLPENPVLSPAEDKFSLCGRGLRTFCHWRDPKLYSSGGKVYALVCATSKTAQGDACGAVAVCSTENLRHWEVPQELAIEAVCQELECPQIARIDDAYVLLFSCYRDLFSAQMQQRYGAQLRQTSYYMVAQEPLGPYRFVPDFQLLPAGEAVGDANQQYANQLVQMNSRWYLLGTVWSEQGDYIADGRTVRFSDGRLVLSGGQPGAAG